jgi:arylsulfatase A-like enzyme
MPHRLPVLFLVLLFGGEWHVTALAQETPSKPNIMVVLTDDQGWSDLGCHGHPIVRTPNLDRMHQQSIRLSNFHVDAFCSPTRAALLTGRMSQRTGVTSTYGLRNLLRTDEAILPEYFKTSGYQTGIFGKWHLGGNYPYRPIDRGFDEWLGLGNGGVGLADDLWDNDRMDDRYWNNGEVVRRDGFCTDVYFEEAMQFARQNKRNQKPFFIYLPTNVPHRANNVPKEWMQPYLNQGCNQEQASFYAGINRVDWNMGRLMKFLDKEKLSGNTLLLFLTDNGSIHPIRKKGTDIDSVSGRRGMKGKLYEGGHRVPLFIRGPEHLIGKPRELSIFSAHVDLLPTFIDLCGLGKPKRSSLPIDGRSLVPVLQGSDDWADRTLFLHTQNGAKGPKKFEETLVMTEQWRLIYHTPDHFELFQIKKDPSQLHDLSTQRPKVVNRLKKANNNYWNNLGGDRPLERPRLSSRSTTWLTNGWQTSIREGITGSGSWPVTVEEPGTYLFELRRWPREAGMVAMRAPLPPASDPKIEYVGNKGNNIPGKTLDIKAVEFSIKNALTLQKEIATATESIKFEIPLREGPLDLTAKLILKSGKKIGAPYLYIFKIQP